jgi:hypothetical protein
MLGNFKLLRIYFFFPIFFLTYNFCTSLDGSEISTKQFLYSCVKYYKIVAPLSL